MNVLSISLRLLIFPSPSSEISKPTRIRKDVHTLKTNAGEEARTTEMLRDHLSLWEFASGWGDVYAGKAEAGGAPHCSHSDFW